LGEVRSVEINESVKGHRQVAESRGVDVGHEVVQIFADPMELEVSESREDRACWRRRRFVSQFPDREFVVVQIESESK
jgi:hypothetical protein